MNKCFLPMAAAVLLLAACSEKPSYEIAGTVTNADLNGKYVYLTEYGVPDAQPFDDAALQAIVRNQLEGAADLINKGTMPTDKLGAYGPDIVKMYNDDYFDSPNVLRQLDSLTCGYLAGTLDVKQYQAAAECAHFEGHTTGDYMVFLIRDQLGQQAAIDCLGDFSAFVQRYNEAARKADGYVFSETFVSHIDSIWSDLQTGE